MIREWQWNEQGSAADGLTLYTDRIVLWSTDWSDRSGGIGREWTIVEFKSSDPSMVISPDVWKELNEEITKLER